MVTGKPLGNSDKMGAKVILRKTSILSRKGQTEVILHRLHACGSSLLYLKVETKCFSWGTRIKETYIDHSSQLHLLQMFCNLWTFFCLYFVFTLFIWFPIVFYCITHIFTLKYLYMYHCQALHIYTLHMFLLPFGCWWKEISFGTLWS